MSTGYSHYDVAYRLNLRTSELEYVTGIFVRSDSLPLNETLPRIIHHSRTSTIAFLT